MEKKSSELNPYIYGQLIFNQDTKRQYNGKGKSFKKGYQSNCVSEKQQQTHTENTLWLPRGEGGGRDQEFETSGCKLSYRMDKQGPHRGTGGYVCVDLSHSAV